MECEQADRARSVVRQGDILAAHPGTANWNDRWRRFYVVLSADCDIVQKKLDAGLVVVPIVGLETFALDIWLPEQIRKHSEAAEKKVEALVRRFEGWAVTPQVLFAMTRSDLDAQLEQRVAGDKELEKPAKSIGLLHHGFEMLKAVGEARLSPNVNLGEQVRVICSAKAEINGAAGDPEKELRSGFASVADPKRTDLWPICDLVGLDGQMREDEKEGFVAALRRFTQIPLESVFLEKAEWLRAPDSYFRVCRLRGIYKSDFLHRFASLFTRVGLDAGRDGEHQRMFDAAAARVLRQKEG